MNRVTGVLEGIGVFLCSVIVNFLFNLEGNYYAATYLYPREKAGLAAELSELPEDRRLRFQYYEGNFY